MLVLFVKEQKKIADRNTAFRIDFCVSSNFRDSFFSGQIGFDDREMLWLIWYRFCGWLVYIKWFEMMMCGVMEG